MSKKNAMDLDVAWDFEITKIEKRDSAPGTWVNGSLSGHTFCALVFPEHATDPEWEIEDSRITKIWIRREADQEVVFNWDRGADIEAQTDEAKAIVGFLCAGLSDHIYG